MGTGKICKGMNRIVQKATGYENQRESLSSVSLRLTAPSAEARRQLFNRPRHPFGAPVA